MTPCEATYTGHIDRVRCHNEPPQGVEEPRPRPSIARAVQTMARLASAVCEGRQGNLVRVY